MRRLAWLVALSIIATPIVARAQPWSGILAPSRAIDWSNAGIPGLTIPAGLGSSSGLPVGISIDGPRGSDQRLLSIGLAIERVLGRTPPPGR